MHAARLDVADHIHNVQGVHFGEHAALGSGQQPAAAQQQAGDTGQAGSGQPLPAALVYTALSNHDRRGHTRVQRKDDVVDPAEP